MSFKYPLGLLGLIGVPILIIIYILRSKYNEQTVPSTYLWTLSEKFFKRRNPLSGITGIISLILQILMVIIRSRAISRPIFVVPDSASESRSGFVAPLFARKLSVTTNSWESFLSFMTDGTSDTESSTFGVR